MSHNDAFALFVLMIGGGSMVIAITAMISKMHDRRLAFKERQLELMAQHTAEKAAQYAADKQTLEARVRVLERIATSSGADVAYEIDLLRGPVN